MNFKSLALVAALAAPFGAQAAALSYVADDFSIPQTTIVGAGSNTAGPGTYFTSRLVSVTNVTGTNGASRVESFTNTLDLTNSAPIDSTKTVTWTWSPTLTAHFANASNVQLTLNVYSESDPSNTNTATPSPVTPVGGVINSGVSNLVFNLGTLGASYGIEFNGNAGWDLNLRSLTITGDCNTGYTMGSGNATNTCVSSVPLPGSVALLGLGLIGLAGLRRRA